jgi:hypothetical protein
MWPRSDVGGDTQHLFNLMWSHRYTESIYTIIAVWNAVVLLRAIMVGCVGWRRRWGHGQGRTLWWGLWRPWSLLHSPPAHTTIEHQYSIVDFRVRQHHLILLSTAHYPASPFEPPLFFLNNTTTTTTTFNLPSTSSVHEIMFVLLAFPISSSPCPIRNPIRVSILMRLNKCEQRFNPFSFVVCHLSFQPFGLLIRKTRGETPTPPRSSSAICPFQVARSGPSSTTCLLSQAREGGRKPPRVVLVLSPCKTWPIYILLRIS